MVKRFSRISAAVVSLLLLTLWLDLCIAATQADETFDIDGVIIKDFGSGDDEVFSLAVQDDGKVLVAGYANNGAVNNLAVARYLTDGTLDAAFNEGGTILLSFGSGETVGHNLVYQDDGNILVAGVTEDSGSKAFIVRITPSGFLDKEFGDSGKRLVAVDGEQVSNTDVVTGDDGSIFLVNGFLTGAGDTNSNILKFNSSGELDNSFGEDGVSELLLDENVKINAISLLSDGKILAAGYFEQDEVRTATLLRFNENGTVDETFNDNGMLKLAIEGENSQLEDVISVAGGSAVLVGYVNNGNYNETFAAKVDSTGQFVTDFAANGMYRSTLEFENKGFAGNINDEGAIQIVGFSDDGSGDDVFILTLKEKTEEDTEGDLVATYLAEDILNNDDVAYSVASLSDGSLLVAGSAENGTDKDFMIMSLSSDASITYPTYLEPEGILAGGYRMLTTPVYSITRTGVVSGGTITEFRAAIPTDEEPASEDDDTEEEETTSEDDLTETEDSTEEVTLSEVILRGVCYGVTPLPEYNADSDPTDPDETDSTTAEEGDGGEGGVFPGDWSSSYIVRSGQTEDGSGTGLYTSDITEITPGTKYYLRAYAVLADETVIYGNQLVFETNDACFIATAAYGSILDDSVVILREFRDRILASSDIGKLIIGAYYKHSPELARIIEEHDFLAAVVRFLLVPVVGISFLLLNMVLVINIALISFVTIMLILMLDKAAGCFKTKNRQAAGFTLIELLVVLVIIGILAGYIGPKIMGHPEEARRTKAGLQLQGLETALKMYKLDNGMYPTTEQGLQALIEPPGTGKLPPKWRDGGYLDKGRMPTDPWGNDFIYLSPGLNDDFDIVSYGADGELGGEGDAQDINSWEIE